MGRKKDSPYKSPLSDNVKPGAPTTMDVLVRWITKPGNVRRWRTNPRAPLVREIVDVMQEEGLAHRQAPFVRYKVEAIEKQYITAKQWLLETGMHDAYMTGKATKEVRMNVDKVCPQFRTLDPAFRGVPFSKKNAETIELDDDSAEDVENEEESGESEEDGEEEDQSKETEEKAVEPPQKRQTFRARLFPDKNTEEDKASTSQTVRVRKGSIAEKKKASSAKSQQNGSSVRESPLEKDPDAQEKVSRQKKKRTSLLKQLAPSSGYAAAEKVRNSKTTEPQSGRSPSVDLLSPSAGDVTRKEKAAPKKKTSVQVVTPVADVAVEQTVPEVVESSPAVDPKKKGRPAKTDQSVQCHICKKTYSSRYHVVRHVRLIHKIDTYTLDDVDGKDADCEGQEDLGGDAGDLNEGSGELPSSNAKETAQAATGKKALTSKTKTSKRKNAGVETIETKRTRTQVQDETETDNLLSIKTKRTRTQVQDETEADNLLSIERAALLKRIDDEEKQRHEMYKLEKTKMKFEVESKQVQLLFEKAVARKKLDQLGISKEEIDRILPL